MWICGALAPCGPSALLATKKASFGIKTCRLAIRNEMRNSKKQFIHLLAFMGQRVEFWVKKWCFGVFWTGCEIADLKQRQKIFKMNYRNKIQWLVSPTDDPGDAPDCMCEYGPVPVNMAISAINRPIFRSMGFPSNPSSILSPSCC